MGHPIMCVWAIGKDKIPLPLDRAGSIHTFPFGKLSSRAPLFFKLRCSGVAHGFPLNGWTQGTALALDPVNLARDELCSRRDGRSRVESPNSPTQCAAC
jgi:hypothetical protein